MATARESTNHKRAYLVQITAAFDGGNIRVIDASDPRDVRLEIVPDAHTGYYQWFYFRVVGAKGVAFRMRIVNADGAYVGGWDNYKAVISYDRQSWRRADTTYNDGVLTISHTPRTNSFYVAYFAPYSLERHADLIAKSLNTGLADLEVLGQSIDGHNLDLLTIGHAKDDRVTFWVTARQHPGETMAEWWMEGFLGRLLDKTDAVASRLRRDVAFFIVPNMNPDGSQRGHLRTNAAGIDLNRAWKAPSLDQSPEVFLVRECMLATKPDFVLDVHGTEDLSHVFLIGPEGPAGRAEPVATLIAEYKLALLAANKDFQTAAGFDTPPDDVVDTLGTNYQGEVLRSLCMTLEMPFKDTTHTPDAEFGWSSERAMQMGRDNVSAMASILPRLKQERGAWR